MKLRRLPLINRASRPGIVLKKANPPPSDWFGCNDSVQSNPPGLPNTIDGLVKARSSGLPAWGGRRNACLIDRAMLLPVIVQIKSLSSHFSGLNTLVRIVYLSSLVVNEPLLSVKTPAPFRTILTCQ